MSGVLFRNVKSRRTKVPKSPNPTKNKTNHPPLFSPPVFLQAHQLMIDAGLRKEDLRDIVDNPRLQLRENVDRFLQLAHEHGVPLHIFSAGLYDVIHAYLQLHGLDKYQAHVVSNMMEFDAQGRLLGFQGSLIHTLNKNSTVLRSSPGWAKIEVRDRRAESAVFGVVGDRR